MYTSASLEAGVTLITSVVITAALVQSQSHGFQLWSLVILTVAALAIEKWCPPRLHLSLLKQRQVPSTGLALGSITIPWVSAALCATYSRESTIEPLYSINCLQDSLVSSAFILASLCFAAILLPAPAETKTAARITRSSDKKEKEKKSTKTIVLQRQQILLLSFFAVAVIFNFGVATAPQVIFSILTSVAYWLCMTQLPKTFTLGEGIVIVQGLGLLAKFLIVDSTAAQRQLSWCAFFTAAVLFAAVVLALFFALLFILRTKSTHNTYIKALHSIIMGIFIVLLAIYAYQPLITDLLINFIFRGDPQRIQVIGGWIILLAVTLPSMLLVSRSSRVPNIIVRKGYHVLAVALFLPALFTQPQLLGIALACAFAVLAAVEVLRIGNIPGVSRRIHSFMGSFVDERDSGALYVTHFTLLLGMALPVWLSNAMDITNDGDSDFNGISGISTKSKLSSIIWPASLAGILATGLGDAAASIVGSQYGRVAIAPKSKKTVEGTLAMAGVVMMAWMGLVYWQYIPEMQCIWGVDNGASANRIIGWVVLGTVTVLNSLLEAATEQLDNLFIPLHYFALLLSLFN